MDHGVIALVVVIRIEPEPIEGLTARRAPIPILAPAAHPHDLPVELRARVETLPLPEATVGAQDQPHRHATRLPTGEPLKLVRCCLPPALGEVPNHEVSRW